MTVTVDTTELIDLARHRLAERAVVPDGGEHQGGHVLLDNIRQFVRRFVAFPTEGAHPFRPPPDLDIFVTMEEKSDAGRASVVSR